MSSYSKYYESISEDELFEGLLAFGLFADKIPPVFTGESFHDFVTNHNPGFPKKDFDFIRYENMRNINVPRLLAVPHPVGYYHLVSVIKDNWVEIKKHIANKTKNQKYKVSKVHLRKIKDSKCLFRMNYKTYEDETSQDVDLVIGMRYMVHADISNCFPSIYSHSIPWALLGKKKAKKKVKGRWQDELDYFLRNTKNQETNGILIGPHTSNLISELVLICIDNQLIEKGYKYTRHVDDYTCYTKSKEEAERFLIDLSVELKHFELTLNHKKSKIEELPHAFVSKWVRKLKHHRFRHYEDKSKKQWLPTQEVEIFLDLAVDLMSREHDNSAILNYALKMLSKLNLDTRAIGYLIKRVHHLCYIYPYLIQFLDKAVFEPFNISKDEIKRISNSMFELGIQKKTYEACCYSIYFSLKYDFQLSGFNIRYEALKSEDCIFMTLAYLYSKKNNNCLIWYHVKAKLLMKNEFDRYWLFIYEVSKALMLTNYYKAMKNRKVTFIKPDYL